MVNATNFDGINDYFLRGGGLTGAADGDKGIASVWIKPSSVFGTQYIFSDSNVRVVMWQQGATVQLFLSNAAGTNLINVMSTNTFAIDTWHHILASWNTTTNTVAIYVDDTDATGIPAVNISGTIDYTATNWALGGSTAGSTKFNGCISELYFNFAEDFDLTVEANRRKFITAGLGFVDLGADGSTPTGTAPIGYFPNPFGTFGTNAGTGGDFTEDAGSSVAACASVPSSTLLTPGLAVRSFVLPDGRKFTDEREARVEYARLKAEEARMRAQEEAERREAARLLEIELAKPRLPDTKFKMTPRPEPKSKAKPPRSRQSLLDPIGWPRLYKD